MSEHHKLVALRLHGLSKKDADWILERIPSYDKTAVAGALKELSDIGFVDVEPLIQKQITKLGLVDAKDSKGKLLTLECDSLKTLLSLATTEQLKLKSKLAPKSIEFLTDYASGL